MDFDHPPRFPIVRHISWANRETSESRAGRSKGTLQVRWVSKIKLLRRTRSLSLCQHCNCLEICPGCNPPFYTLSVGIGSNDRAQNNHGWKSQCGSLGESLGIAWIGIKWWGRVAVDGQVGVWLIDVKWIDRVKVGGWIFLRGCSKATSFSNSKRSKPTTRREKKKFR